MEGTEVRPNGKEHQPTVQRSLVQKLAEAGAAIGWIEKTGRNTFHNYAYATEADLVSRLRGELFSRGVFVFPSTLSVERNSITVRSIKNGQVNERETSLTNVMVRWTFVDGETGETMACDMPGCGEDSGDKGVYKAMTGSEKYLLMKAFLIPTGDDPEKDTDTEKAEAWDRGTQAQKEVAQRKIAEANAKEVLPLKVIPVDGGESRLEGKGLQRLLTALDAKDANFKKDSMRWDGGEGFWYVRSGKAFILVDICTSIGVNAVLADAEGKAEIKPTGESVDDSDLPANVFPEKRLSGFKCPAKSKAFFFMWDGLECSGWQNQKDAMEAIQKGCEANADAELEIEVKPNAKDPSKPYRNLKAIKRIGTHDYTHDQSVGG